MKIYPLLLLTTLVGCLVASESSPASERNAALQYWLACSQLPKSGQPDWLKTMLEKPDQRTDPAAEQANSLALRYLHLGADCAEGNFGTIVGGEAFGAEAIVPHIGLVRQLAHFAIARARWRFEHGRSAEALADCRAVLALGADLSNGSTYFELLTAMIIHDKVLNTIARYLPVCQATERANLSNFLGSSRVQLHRDFSRGDSAMLRQMTTLLAQMQDSENKPTYPAELVAAAKDPRIEVWHREYTSRIALSLTLVDLSAEDFANQRASIETIPHDNPLVHTNLKHLFYTIQSLRALKARAELLVAAARAFDQPGGVQTLAGFLTCEGAATVTENDGVATVQVVRPGNAKPIEIVIGAPR